MSITILDGPIGTELLARGWPTPLPGWSAHCLESAEGRALLGQIHADYARAGATVHTANTFRTRRRTFPDWADLARQAVQVARAALPRGHWLAGSLAPLEDCYSPWLSPSNPGPEHAELAQVLAGAGCDLLLCETFPHLGEAEAALDAALATGLPAWISWTAGPWAELLRPADLERAAARAVARGAAAVLVNCVAAPRCLDYVRALAQSGAPVGVYANAGAPEEGMGWRADPPDLGRYLDLSSTWAEAGATLIGGCCGTGPGLIAALARRHSPPLPPGLV